MIEKGKERKGGRNKNIYAIQLIYYAIKII